MLNVYERVLQVIDESKMSESGFYLTYYESLDVLAGELDLDVDSAEFEEDFSNKFRVAVDELESEDFIAFDTAGSEYGIIFDDKEDSFDDIVRFLSSEKSYRKYIKK